MRAEDRACSLVLLGIAIASCLGALQYEVGTFSNPGPGLSPLILGTALGILSLIILAGGVAAAKRGAALNATVVERAPIFKKESILVIAVLIFYGFLLERLGFIVATFLLFSILFKFVAKQNWLMALAEGLVLALGAYVIFETILDVPLPAGILGFN